jgi:AraC-like DNA-binding protein
MSFIYNHHTFLDFDAYQEMLAHEEAIDVVVRQLSSGKYVCQNQVLTLPGLDLIKREISCKTIEMGILTGDALYLALVETDEPLKVNGTEIPTDRLYVFGAQQEIVEILPRCLKAYLIAIPHQTLIKYLGLELALYVQKNVEGIRCGKLTLPYYSEFKAKMLRYVEVLFREHNHYHQVAVDDVQDTIMCQVYGLFCHLENHRKAVTDYQNNRFRIVQRAIEFIDSQTQLHLDIADIAEQSFCSIRTLEYAFKQVCGLSPKKYLIIRRLHLLRKELAVEHSKRCIKDILYSHGIVNTGRFSQDFYQLFGEYPSETMARSRLKHARTGVPS